MTARGRWAPDELTPFLAAARDTRLEAAWHLIAFAGLRIGELIAFRCDVDLDRLRVTVRDAVTGAPYAALAVPAMAMRAREVNLKPDPVEVIHRHGLRQATEQSEWGAYYAGHNLVVCGESGGPLHPHALHRAFCEACGRAGVRPIAEAMLRRAGRAPVSREGVLA